MGNYDKSSAAAQPVTAQMRANLVEPFIAATRGTLSEMACVDVAAQTTWRTAEAPTLGDISAGLTLTSARESSLIFSFPESTAAAFARRILGGVAKELDLSLIQDCVGEIANVIAGQAKAMLADTPYRFTYSIPHVVSGASVESRPKEPANCLVIAFTSELGEFALQLYLKP